MSKLSFRARALDASKPMPIYLAEDLPDLPEYSAINRAVPQMPSGMEKEEECEHHLQRAICTGLIIPTPEVCSVHDLDFYERCYPPDYKMPKQHIHMQPLWHEQETPEYDIDSEDDRWLRQQRHPELTELKFEQMMDKLERCSGQTVVTLVEAKSLLERQDDLVVAVYDYWLNKRLKTQHPLVLSVKTETRTGQSTNNPYLAFRRRTEKMQTRKNRKNDESSYEKMLKLRRDLARTAIILETVVRRERLKQEMVRIEAATAESRFQCGDYAGHLLAEVAQHAQPVRPSYNAVSLTTAGAGFRREVFPHHYPPRAPPAPVDQPRQREKRPYKRRKHRHHTPGAAHVARDSGVYSSSSEEGSAEVGGAAHDDGPFTFRRKPGCFYEMPTSTLYGDPLEPERSANGSLCEHEVDSRLRYTLTSINEPYRRCIGFARRRLGRGGRVLLDRVATPLDDLWPQLPSRTSRRPRAAGGGGPQREPRVRDLDYHTGGKYPWRHAFRRHLSRNPALWFEEGESETPPAAPAAPAAAPKREPRLSDDGAGAELLPRSVESDISLSDPRTIDAAVLASLARYVGEGEEMCCRPGDTDDPHDPDQSLRSEEKEFERFIDEVNRKWLHFRPKTPPPEPVPHAAEEGVTLAPQTPFSVHIHTSSGEDPLLTDTSPFTTAEFSLAHLLPGTLPDLDAVEDDFAGLTEAQVDSILSDTDLKAIAPDDILQELVQDDKDPFLSRGQSASDGRGDSGPRLKGASFGSSVVNVTPLARPPLVLDPPPAPRAPDAPLPVPNSRIIVEEVNEVPHVRVKAEAPPPAKKRKEEPQEEPFKPKHSPVKKQVVATPQRRQDAAAPHMVTVAVSESLKVRLQNHLLSTSQGAVVVGGLMQNGPVTVVPANLPTVTREGLAGGVSRRMTAPIVHLQKPLHQPVVVTQQLPLHSVAANKLKVLHAHALTQSQRTQLLAQSRASGLTQMPTVVSLSTLGDGKATPTAALQLKAAPGSVAQFFEIKAGQLAAKGAHLVNVVRQPQPARRGGQVLATFDGGALKVRSRCSVPAAGTMATVATVARPLVGGGSLLQRGVALPRPGQKIAIAGAANVHALALTAAHLKARQARLVAPSRVARPPHQAHVAAVTDIVESTTTPIATSSTVTEAPLQSVSDAGEASTNGTVRRRPTDSLPMEVT